jgi:hypothetical protein
VIRIRIRIRVRAIRIRIIDRQKVRRRFSCKTSCISLTAYNIFVNVSTG